MLDELQSGNQQMIRDINVSNVLNVLRVQDAVSRVELSHALGLGKSTITVIINALMSCGAVEEMGAQQSSIGRKPRSLRMNSNWKYVIAVRLDISQVHVGIINLKGQIIYDKKIAKPLRGYSWEDILRELVPLVRTICLDAKIDWEHDVLGVALALPGVINTSTVSISRLSKWPEFPIASWLSETLGKAVAVENDANALCLGERMKYTPANLDDMLVMLVEDGIGAGIIANGMMVKGGSLGAGQIGHMKVSDDGMLCSCGQTGCLETFVSNSAVKTNFVARLSPEAAEEIAGKIGTPLDQIDAQIIARLAMQGVPEALGVMDEVGFYMGRAITTVVNILNPAGIVIGGPLFEEAEHLMLERVWKMIRAETAPVLWSNLQLRVLRDKTKTMLIGVASQILDRAFRVRHDGSPDTMEVSLVSMVGF